MRTQVVHLKQDILLNQLGKESLPVFLWSKGLGHTDRGFRRKQPSFDSRQLIKRFRFQQTLHCSAIGVPTNYDLLYLERRDRIFNDSGDAAEHATIGGDYIADIARYKDVTRPRPRTQPTLQPRICTEDENSLRTLDLVRYPLVK